MSPTCANCGSEAELQWVCEHCGARWARSTEYPGAPGEHRWIAHGLDAYHAVNLREALKLVPDTGDWHGSLRAACEIALRDDPAIKPNASVDEQRMMVYRAALSTDLSTENLIKLCVERGLIRWST